MRETPETGCKYIIKFCFYPGGANPCGAVLCNAYGDAFLETCAWGATWQEVETKVIERFRLWKLSQVPEDKEIYLT